MGSERRSVITDWNEVNRSVYSRLGEIREDMRMGQHGGADPSAVALEALDSLNQFLAAVKLDFGV